MNNSGRHDPSIDFLTKPPPRSFSIDVGSMQTNHGSPNYSTSFFFDTENQGKSYIYMLHYYAWQ
jgi:hypothetical protein